MLPIPYDIELIVYRYLHELHMIDICKQINDVVLKNIEFIHYLKRRSFCSFYSIIIKIEISPYFIKIIDKYIHKEKMKRVLYNLNKIQ